MTDGKEVLVEMQTGVWVVAIRKWWGDGEDCNGEEETGEGGVEWSGEGESREWGGFDCIGGEVKGGKEIRGGG